MYPRAMFLSPRKPFIGVARNRYSEKISPPEVFSGKDVPKTCSKLTIEHPYRSAISNEIVLRHGRSLISLRHIFRTPFLKNIPGRVLLNILV